MSRRFGSNGSAPDKLRQISQGNELPASPPTSALASRESQQHRFKLDGLSADSTTSSSTDFGLCELLPKRTWIVGDSFVHPNWYVRRKKTRTQRPWQALGMRESWRATDIMDDLEARTNVELGLGDVEKRRFVNVKEFDDPSLFKFDATNEVNEVLTDPVYDYNTFHAPVHGKSTIGEARKAYKRPKYIDLDTNLNASKSAAQPVTVKALMLDGQVAAFVTCPASPKCSQTSDTVFKLLEETLAKCNTLLPKDDFTVIPPKGKDTSKIHGPDEKVTKKANSKKAAIKRRKKGTKKKKLVKKEKLVERSLSEEKRAQRQALLKEETPDQVWFGSPGTPLELANDFLGLRELKGEERRAAAKQLMFKEAGPDEVFKAKRWRCLAKKHWRFKRERNILQRYLYQLQTESTTRSRKSSVPKTLLQENADSVNVDPLLTNSAASNHVISPGDLPPVACGNSSRTELLFANTPTNDGLIDGDWIDEAVINRLADDPVADYQHHPPNLHCATGKRLKIKAVAESANVLYSMFDDHHVMSDKNARKLVRAFRQLGLNAVEVEDEDVERNEVPFISMVSGAVDKAKEPEI
ncbi:uncharacterized protein LOC129600850 [Paramacrobiotus metropolitanus]|uniref:uncharacterized protein LOC129600850 n=1 Tax=Paramacrobiotus metropolitanus TaxID=2943436 RepID=UPI002445FBCA|nr:uncharacterized protein LOC129600850 [Paramacrobiotus metropolitanus]